MLSSGEKLMAFWLDKKIGWSRPSYDPSRKDYNYISGSTGTEFVSLNARKNPEGVLLECMTEVSGSPIIDGEKQILSSSEVGARYKRYLSFLGRGIKKLCETEHLPVPEHLLSLEYQYQMLGTVSVPQRKLRTDHGLVFLPDNYSYLKSKLFNSYVSAMETLGSAQPKPIGSLLGIRQMGWYIAPDNLTVERPTKVILRSIGLSRLGRKWPHEWSDVHRGKASLKMMDQAFEIER